MSHAEKAPRGSLKKNTYFLAVSQFGQFFLAFFLNWVAARQLGVEDYGVYTLASVLFYFVFLFNDMGVVTYVTREVAKDRGKVAAYFFNSIALKIVLIVLSATFLCIWMGIRQYPSDKMLPIIIFSGYGIFYSINQLCAAVYRGFEQMEFEMAYLLFEKILITGLGIWVLYQGYGLFGFSMVFVFSAFMSLSVNLFIVRRRFVQKIERADWGFMKKLLRASFFMGLFWFITSIHERVDVLMLDTLKEDVVVGLYGMAYKLFMVMNVIPMVLMNATFPRISQQSGVNDREVESIYQIGFKYLFYIAVPMIVGVQFLAKDIVLFFGDEFARSAPALRVLVFSAGIDFFSVFFAGFLIAWNMQRRLTFLQAGALILNFSANLILIPSLEHVGAALATVLSRGLIFVVCFIWLAKRIPSLPWRSMLLGLLATAVMAGFLVIFKPILIVSLAISAILVGVVLFLTGGIRLDEILLIRKKT